MNAKKFFVLALVVLLLLTLPLAAEKGKPAPQKNGQAVQIAPQVAAVMDADVALRTEPQRHPPDLPEDPLSPDPAEPELPGVPVPAQERRSGFCRPGGSARPAQGEPLRFHPRLSPRERRCRRDRPASISSASIWRKSWQGFQPEALNYYSIAGDTYPAGTYLLALALSTPDFTKISTLYAEFTLPDFAQLKDQLATTPIFSVSSLQMLPAADTKLTVHKNSFVYNTLMLAPSPEQ